MQALQSDACLQATVPLAIAALALSRLLCVCCDKIASIKPNGGCVVPCADASRSCSDVIALCHQSRSSALKVHT